MRSEYLQHHRRERLHELVKTQFADNPNQLGRALGWSDGAFIRQMLNGKTISEKTIGQIEQLPGLANWFSKRVYGDEPAVRALEVQEPVPEDVIDVPVYRVRFSAGPGHEAAYEIEETSQPAYYQRAWFTKQRIAPHAARRFLVTGDSMEPFIHAGDYVLVDTGDTSVVDGKVYALRYGDHLRIKRVWRHLDGSLTLRSDNPRHADERVPPELVSDQISIVGRVRDRSGSGDL